MKALRRAADHASALLRAKKPFLPSVREAATLFRVDFGALQQELAERSARARARRAERRNRPLPLLESSGKGRRAKTSSEPKKRAA